MRMVRQILLNQTKVRGRYKKSSTQEMVMKILMAMVTKANKRQIQQIAQKRKLTMKKHLHRRGKVWSKN